MNVKMSTVRRYRVMSQPTQHERERFEKAIRAHVLVPIDPEKNLTETKSVGWCSAHDEQDLSLDLGKCIMRTDRGLTVVLCMRVDTLKADRAQVKELTRKRQREIEAERQAPLSALALRELRDMIALDLRRKTPAKVRTVFMLWFVEEQRLYFFSHSKGMNETFMTLFAQTFNVPIDFEGPGFWVQQFSNDLNIAPTVQMMHGFTGLHPAAHASEQQEATGTSADLTDYRYLGREFLTWLVFRVTTDDGFSVRGGCADESFRVVIGEKMSLRLYGDGAKAQTHSGTAPAQTQDVHFAIAGGCTVREMDLMFERGDRIWMATVSAESFSLKRVKLPALLSDEDTERAHERIVLFWELDEMLRAAFLGFLAKRTNRTQWLDVQIPAMLRWLNASIYHAGAAT